MNTQPQPLPKEPPPLPGIYNPAYPPPCITPERTSSFRKWLFILALMALGVFVIFEVSQATSRKLLGPTTSEPASLPDDINTNAKRDGAKQRINNTVDEYEMLVTRYGYPNTILSTENNKKDKALFDTRLVTYDLPGVRVSIWLAPIGCVDKFIAGWGDLHAAARGKFTCHYTSGWTIMDYGTRGPNDRAVTANITAEQATTLLGRIRIKRTIPPQRIKE